MVYTASTLPSYAPSGISFELDGTGGYSARHFAGGAGSVTLDPGTAVISFRGGPMNGWVGITGRNTAGLFVRIRLKAPSTVATTMKLGDAACYLQKT